jgi:two-component system cell cycle response regulator DivK
MSSPETILYIEDNPENRMLIRRILQAEGYSVLEAGNAAEAFHVIEANSPDLILMDINLPEMDGYVLTAQLKTLPILKRTPIIAVTANVMRGDREKTLKAGCDGYIQKPIDVDTLPVQISHFLKR